MSICCFGDSITHGYRDEECGGWVSRLRTLLWRGGHGVPVYNHGVPGDTSGNLRMRFADELQHRQAEVVTLAVGANDVQLLGDAAHPRLTGEEFSANLRELVHLARRQVRWVFLLGITHIEVALCDRKPGRPVFLTAARLAEFDRRISEVAGESGAYHIPLHDQIGPQDLIDGVHPNAAGHARIATAVLTALQACDLFLPK